MESISIFSLWLPILLSAVFVWIGSAIIWMVLPHHKSDFKGLPDEEAARNALMPQSIPAGQYDMPHIPSPDAIKDPEVKKKFDDGPVGFFTVLPNGVPSMGKNMVFSFIYYVVVSIFVAYVASRTLIGEVEYLSVFRVVGTVAWLAYGFGVVQDAIWFGKPWSSVVKHLIDSLIYALLTAGAFGWLWPN